MIALFGGSFDPIHEGHVKLARDILTHYPIQHFYFVPAKKNPLKTQAPGASAADRWEMVRLAVRALADDRVGCLDWEITRDEPSYTVVTLERLHRQEKAALALVLGNEVFRELPSWHQPKRVLELASCIVAMRREETGFDADKVLREVGVADAKQDRQGKRWIYAKGNRWVERHDLSALPFSSTELRNELRRALAQGGNMPPGIQREVWLYIKENRLYAVSE